MSGDTVVWSEDDSPVQHSISIRSLRVQVTLFRTRKQLVHARVIPGMELPALTRWTPSVYGDRIVWLQGFPAGTNRGSDITFLNSTTNEMTFINESGTAHGGLKIMETMLSGIPIRKEMKPGPALSFTILRRERIRLSLPILLCRC